MRSLLRAWTTVTQPKSTTDTLQRVLNAAARLVTNGHQYDRDLLSLLYDQLHWLDEPERVQYKLAVISVMVRRCLEIKTPKYFERPLHSGYRRQQTTSTISQPASADCTALSEDYIWSSSFLSGRPDGLELTTV